MEVYNGNSLIADKVAKADTFFSRFRGLMGKRSIGAGEGLLLLHCPSIHCFFMKTAIDAVYLTQTMEVVGVETLHPWSVGRRLKKTVHVLELAPGSAKVGVGDVLDIRT